MLGCIVILVGVTITIVVVVVVVVIIIILIATVVLSWAYFCGCYYWLHGLSWAPLGLSCWVNFQMQTNGKNGLPFSSRSPSPSPASSYAPSPLPARNAGGRPAPALSPPRASRPSGARWTGLSQVSQSGRYTLSNADSPAAGRDAKKRVSVTGGWV